MNCSSISSLQECANEPSCDVVGKDPWGKSCFHYLNDPRGVPSFCTCQRFGGTKLLLHRQSIVVGYYLLSYIGDSIIIYIITFLVCGTAYAYHSGKMLNDNAPARNPQDCLSKCKTWMGCKFWDFGDGFCRLRSNDGNGAEVAAGYTFGSNNCFFGKYLSIYSYLDYRNK